MTVLTIMKEALSERFLTLKEKGRERKNFDNEINLVSDLPSR